LHGAAPGAVLEVIDVVVPVVSDCTHFADIALDHLGLDQWVSRDNARLPAGVTLRTRKGMFVEALIPAEFTSAGRQSLLRAIHVNLKDPITDLVTLLGRKQVLFREGDLVGRGNISLFEIGVVGDTIVLRIFNGVIQVNVAVEENVSEVVSTNLLGGVTSVEESLISSDILGVSEEGSAESSVYFVEVFTSSFALQ
jgi:hypothetical protein